jgi:Ca-activated chloride channel family protein
MRVCTSHAKSQGSRTGSGIGPTLHFALLSIGFIFWVAFYSAGQTDLDEVHVQPRVAPSPTAIAGQLPGIADLIGGHAIKVNVDLVLVPVTITDAMNRLVQGLDKESFQVFEGKHPQQIRYFSKEDAPVSLGIILDLSGSMKSKLERAKDAVLDFLNRANPQDEFFLITFSDRPEEVADFTQHVEDIQSKLAFTLPKGRTALLDAIYLGIKKMQQAQYQRKALLIISDGGDNHSRYTEHEVVSLVKEADVMIYAIGVYSSYFPTQEEYLGPQLLHEVSEVTGGTDFTIDNANDLSDAARSVGVMLRNQYLIGYRPAEAKKDGKWRKIKVMLKRPLRHRFSGAFRVYAKAGYYAPAQ